MPLQAPGRIDLQPGYYLELLTSHASALAEDNPVGEAVGAIEHHPRPDGQGDCAGFIAFRGKREGTMEPGPEWEIVQEDPLTLSPPISCRRCGAHGHIQEGRWVTC